MLNMSIMDNRVPFHIIKLFREKTKWTVDRYKKLDYDFLPRDTSELE